MILTNPGGPGGSGVDQITSDLSYDLQAIGSNYDYVSWDPRGIGYSIPAANCTPIVDSTSSKVRRALDAQSKDVEDPMLPLYDDYVFNVAKEAGKVCGQAIGGPDDAGPHMSTAVVARDMISILDAFAASPDGRRSKNAALLNFWGFSYGTMIGTHFYLVTYCR
jgi:pimeloyl-ACP methyl ester carboxylesterase